MELMKDDAEGAIRSIRGRQAFNERLDRVIEAAQTAILPLFHSDGGPDHHLSAAETELMHEIMFKLAILRSVIIYREVPAQAVHGRWLDAQTIRQRRRVLSRRKAAGPPTLSGRPAASNAAI